MGCEELNSHAPDTNDWELTCCNVMLACVGDGQSKLFVNDIVTGKRIECVHDDVPSEALWESVENVVKAYADSGAGLPGTMMFFGYRTETEASIEYDWSAATPCFAMNALVSVACYVRARAQDDQLQIGFFDTVTDKPILFKGLDSNYNLMNSIQAIGRAAAFSTAYGKDGRALVILCAGVEHRKDGIMIDAGAVIKISDKDAIYKDMTKNILGTAGLGPSESSA